MINVDNGAEVNVQSDWDATSGDAFIQNKPTRLSDFTNDLTLAPSNAEQNVQANWNENNTSSDAYIQNKPGLPQAV